MPGRGRPTIPELEEGEKDHREQHAVPTVRGSCQIRDGHGEGHAS